ncbi:MAG: hypothetical protein GY710_19355 [Desulfobacteraceae bacterium]|nr:hypothetical protein [Desulfobacteraceae bacterium]
MMRRYFFVILVCFILTGCTTQSQKFVNNKIENQQIIKKLIHDGFGDPIFINSDKNYYMVSKAPEQNQQEFIIASVYDHEKSWESPDRSKFFSAYHIAYYSIGDVYITINKTDYFHKDGSLAHSSSEKRMYNLNPASALARQLKYLLKVTARIPKSSIATRE